jgi:2-oxoglutarate dehydrogenase E2 component (dihydrolipoamide succinyltransferase)
MLTTFNECDMSAVLALRQPIQRELREAIRHRPGLHELLPQGRRGRAPDLPAGELLIIGDEEGKPAVQKHNYCDIAIAVASPKGLVVPVIRSAETLSFAAIEQAVKDLATKAKDGKLTLEEMQGGTFTITNGGIFGSLMSTPILNPPQSGILGMHAIKNRAVEDPANPGAVVIRPMM